MVQAGRSAAAEAQRDAAKAARRELRKQKTMVKIDEAAQGKPLRANSRNVHAFDRVGLEALYGEKPPDEVIGPSGKVYRGEAFFCLKTHSKPRVWAISLVESKPFDPFILAVICANCFTLAWQSPLDPLGTPKALFIDQCEVFYLAVFTGELLAKMLAYGVLSHPDSYLRDGWCQLDFVVVFLAWLPVIDPSFGNFSAFRSVRALRPLRALRRVPGMPVLVKSIIDAVPRLSVVAALVGVVLLVFGIIGVELFKGSLHHHCVTDGYNDALRLDPTNVLLATSSLCDPARPHCAAGQRCAYFAATPHASTFSFDNMGVAIVALLQSVTFDDYGRILFALQNTFSELSWLYFVLVIVICGFFIIKCAFQVATRSFVSNTRAPSSQLHSTHPHLRPIALLILLRYRVPHVDSPHARTRMHTLT